MASCRSRGPRECDSSMIEEDCPSSRSSHLMPNNMKYCDNASEYQRSVDEGIYSITDTENVSLSMKAQSGVENSDSNHQSSLQTQSSVNKQSEYSDHIDSGIVEDSFLNSGNDGLNIISRFANLSTDEPRNISTVPPPVDFHELIFSKDEDGDTQLHLVIIHNDLMKATQCLACARSQNEINIQNDCRQSPLHLAVITRQCNLIPYLVKWGALLDLRDRFGNTPLHLACKYGYDDCVWLLMSLSYGVSCSEKMPKPPYEIIMRNKPLDIGCTNYEGETCLHLAALNMHINVLQVLLNNFKIDINVTEHKMGRTILHQAVEFEHVDMVKFLVNNNTGIDIDARTYAGWTALELASSKEPTERREEIVRILISAGASPPVPLSDEESDIDDDMDNDDIDDFEIAGMKCD